jgi:hypothetical protein
MVMVRVTRQIIVVRARKRRLLAGKTLMMIWVKKPLIWRRMAMRIALKRRVTGRMTMHILVTRRAWLPPQIALPFLLLIILLRRRCVLRASRAERPGLPVWPHLITIFVADASNVMRRSPAQVEVTPFNVYG